MSAGRKSTATRTITRAIVVLGACTGISILGAAPASASVITGYEVIWDTTCTPSGGCTGDNDHAGHRNLERTRQVGSGGPVTESSDSTIVSQNSIDNYFAFYEHHDVTYTHVLNTWLSPMPAGFLSAALTVKSYGANGNNDIVIADTTLTLGNLGNSGSSIVTNSWGVLTTYLTDGILNVRLDQNGSGDKVNLFYSRLDFSFDDGVSEAPPAASTPEPASLTLLGTAVAGLVGRRMRRKAQKA